jgi:hypothetical protein
MNFPVVHAFRPTRIHPSLQSHCRKDPPRMPLILLNCMMLSMSSFVFLHNLFILLSTSMQRRSSISSMLSCSQVTILTASTVKEIDKMIEILASAVNKLIRFYYPLDQPTEADSTRSSDDETSREARRMLKSELSVDDCHTLAALLLGNDRTMSLLSSKSPSSFSFSADLDHHADDDSTCLVPALLSIFSFGFRAKMALGPKKHVWDFVHRAARQMTPGGLLHD